MPNIAFADGFDTYTSLPGKWDTAMTANNVPAGPPTIVQGAGRGGAGALYVDPHLAQSGTFLTFYQVQKNLGAHASGWFGFAFYVDTTSQVADNCLMQWVDGPTVQVSLWLTKTGTLYFTRGTVNGTNVLATAGSAYPNGSYHFLEVRVTIDGSAGVVQARVDETLVSGLNVSSLNTKVSANSSFDAIRLGCLIQTSGINQPNYTAYFDDFYFDTAAFNGDHRIAGLLPTGDGSVQNFSMVEAVWAAASITKLGTTIIDSNGNLQRCTAITGDFKTGTPTHPTWATSTGTTTDNHVTWTFLGTPAHYLLVNEPDPDGDSSYVQSSTVGHIERYTFPPIAGTSVLALLIWTNGRKDDGGLRALQGSIKSGASTGLTGVDIPLGSNYQFLMHQSFTDPNTSAPWTVAGINAAEIGFEISV